VTVELESLGERLHGSFRIRRLFPAVAGAFPLRANLGLVEVLELLVAAFSAFFDHKEKKTRPYHFSTLVDSYESSSSHIRKVLATVKALISKD
jgi:hypothetical protein